MIALNGARYQFELLSARRVDGKVDEAPLYLRPLIGPLIARLLRKAIGIFLESLMQCADDKKTPVAPGCGFGKLLEDVDIGAVMRGGLGKLAHLVDEQQQPAMRSRSG